MATLVAVLSTGLVVAAAAGPELGINSFTATTQSSAAVAMADDGGFVVVWQSLFQDGAGGTGVFGQRFDANAARVGAEFSVNSFTDGSQLEPAVAIGAGGDFVVVWHSASPYGPAYGVFGQRFAGNGARLGGEFRVNTYTPGTQYHPSIAMEDDGDFVIVWSSYQDAGTPPSGFGVFGQRYASSGAAIASEFQVHTYQTNQQSRAAVAADADGDFVVTWRSYTQDGEPAYRGTFARRFSSTGAALASEFQVNTYTPFDQEYSTAAMDHDGDFLIAWQGVRDGNNEGVFAQRFASSGSRVGGELQINAWTLSDQRLAAATVDASGHFVVAWQSRGGQDGDAGGTFARRVSLAGGLLGGEFQVNTHTTGYQMAPAVAMTGGGDLVVVWQSEDQDGGGEYGIVGRRFSAPPLRDLDVDGDGRSEPLTDGILFLRYLFGFSDQALVALAVNLAGCTRCDGDAVQSHLASLGDELDIDGDGVALPLTDGLLAVRFLFSFTGTSLTGGAVDPGCTRCSAEAIVDYLTRFSE